MTHPRAIETARAVRSLLERGADGLLRRLEVVELAASDPPWVDTGVPLEPGEQVTTICLGRAYLDPANDLWLRPEVQVWFRVGERGEIFRGSRATNTFTATHAGTIQLGNAHPGEWTDRYGGTATDPVLYSLLSGELAVVVLVWERDVDPAAALRDLTMHGDVDGLLAGEADRLKLQADALPEGWEHLWKLGPSEIFTFHEHAIACSTRGDFGIIRYAVDQPLDASTTLAWSWRVDSLPSREPEDAFATHDYLSIAVELDNGKDLTYQWSSALDEGYHYACPLPHWDQRETHLVIRSGSTALGRWVDERRPVLADYHATVGGPAPRRITAVWLIALSMLQRGSADARYRNIAIRQPTGSVPIGPQRASSR